MAKTTISVGGMDCASCSANVEKALKKVAGVKSAVVNFATERATIEYDEKVSDRKKLEDAIEGAGYEPERE